ncbi:hypothetical protein NUM3379_42420 [Kineococcus sp. NUM-3379]
MTVDAAPEGLEAVRAFLNTWRVPNDTRRGVDDLDDLAADAGAWARTVPGVPCPPAGEVAGLRALREALRAHLAAAHPVGLAAELERYPLRPRLRGRGAPVRLEPVTPSTAGDLLALAVDAVGDGTWHRLRSCPGCDFVFYDSTRNGGRTWCRMVREDPSGRSCGSLAKARAKRARDRAGDPADG